MIHILLKPSKKLACFFIALHVMAVSSVVFSGAPLWLIICGLCLCVGSFLYIWQRYVRLNAKNAVVQLMIGEDKRWRLVQKNGQVKEVMLKRDLVVTSFLLIFNVRSIIGRQHFSFLVCRDSVVECDNFRKLCVYVRTNTLKNTVIPAQA